MQKRAVTLAVLVVGASLAALVPAGAIGDSTPQADNAPPIHDAPSDKLGQQAHAAERAPPKLPEQWQETYGGDGDEIFADLVRTADGGYLVVGWTERDGADDGWLVKVDSDGEQQWAETLGGDGIDRFWGVVPTDDGYLLAGRTDEDGGPNGWIVEVTSDGEVVRERTSDSGAFYAVARDANDSESSETVTSDDSSDESEESGYLLAGWTRGDGKDGWLVKLDGDRSEAWQANIPAPEEYRNGYLRAVVPTESGYYLAGKIEGDSDDGWALKVDASGEREWETAVGGPSRDDVWAAAPLSQNAERDGFVFAGETESDSDGPRDGWLVAFGSEGSVEWERKPGGPGTQWLDSAMRTEDGFLFTGGSNQGPYGSADGYVLVTDDAGTQRTESYYGTGAWDKPWPAIRAHDGSYLLAGKTMGGDGGSGDGWLLKIGEETNDTSTEETTTATDTSSATTATDASDESTEPDTSDETTPTDTSDEALQAGTSTATDTSGSIPGFGVGTVLVALAVVLLALRR